MPKTPPSQESVARLAKVARSTVSMALSGDKRIAEKTRLRVQRAAEKIGYNPHLSLDAQRMAARRNNVPFRVNTLGLVWRVLDPAQPQSSFRLQLLDGILEGCQATGQCLLVVNLAWERMQVLRSISQLDGLILEGAFAEETQLVRELGKPLVTILSDLPGVADVGIDNAAAVRLAFAHLHQRGHRKIGWIGPDLKSAVACARWTAYCACIKDAGLAYDPRHACSDIALFQDQAAAAFRKIWNGTDRPTALLIYNDFLALGVLQAAREIGARIPQDLSMVSIDDIPEAAHSNPPLTTVSIGLRALGRHAACLLEEFARTRTYAAVREQLAEFQLRERGTVASL